MKKLIFTFAFIAGIAISSFAQNAATKQKGTPAPLNERLVNAAKAKQVSTPEASNDLNPATFAAAVNTTPTTPVTTGKFNKAAATKAAATKVANPKTNAKAN